MYMRFRDFCDPEWQVERRVSVPLLPPDKSKYFPSLIKPPRHIRYKAIVRWASAKKHSFPFLSISYLITLQSYMNFPYLKLPPNQTCLVSPLAWPLLCTLRPVWSWAGDQEPGETRPQPEPGWWLTHNSCLACDQSEEWGEETDQGCIWPPVISPRKWLSQ